MLVLDAKKWEAFAAPYARRRGASARRERTWAFKAKDLETSLKALGGIEPAFAAALARVGLPEPRDRRARLRHPAARDRRPAGLGQGGGGDLGPGRGGDRRRRRSRQHGRGPATRTCAPPASPARRSPMRKSLAEEVLSGRLDFDAPPRRRRGGDRPSDRGQGDRPLDRRNLSAVRRGPPRHLPRRRPRRPDRDRRHHGPGRAGRPRKRSARWPNPGAPTAAPRRCSPGTTGAWQSDHPGRTELDGSAGRCIRVDSTQPGPRTRVLRGTRWRGAAALCVSGLVVHSLGERRGLAQRDRATATAPSEIRTRPTQRQALAHSRTSGDRASTRSGRATAEGHAAERLHPADPDAIGPHLSVLRRNGIRRGRRGHSSRCRLGMNRSGAARTAPLRPAARAAVRRARRGVNGSSSSTGASSPAAAAQRPERGVAGREDRPADRGRSRRSRAPPRRRPCPA